ncbi:MAG: AI-2E family transporter [Candidatus Moranbacteria bacterium]|nr:AI-2E family transporter [Candidatus Moranbacteria bacterium]
MKQHINSIFLLALIIIVGLGVYYIFQPFIIPIFLAFLISQFFKGWYNKLNKKLKKFPSIASFIMCIVVFLLLILPLILASSLIINEIKGVYDYLSENDWQGKIESFLNQDSVKQLGLDYENFKFEHYLQTKEFSDAAKSFSNFGLKAVQKTYESTSNFIMMTFILFFTLFYLFKDNQRIIDKIKRISPLKDKQEDLLFEKFISISKATIKGSLVIAIVQGSLLGVSFWIAGVPSPAIWALIATVLSLIPLVGPAFVWLPVGLVLLLTGGIWQGIFVMIFGALVVGTIDNVLRPKLVGDQSSLHPLLVFFSTIGGIAFFGLMGFLIGPIIVVLFITLLSIYEIEFKKELKKFNG